jgi:hypothetical protein
MKEIRVSEEMTDSKVGAKKQTTLEHLPGIRN